MTASQCTPPPKSTNTTAATQLQLLFKWPIKVKACVKLLMAPHPIAQIQGTTATWDHTVLPATCHKYTHPALTPARQASIQFTYQMGWSQLTYVTGYILRGLPTHSWSQY